MRPVTCGCSGHLFRNDVLSRPEGKSSSAAQWKLSVTPQTILGKSFITLHGHFFFSFFMKEEGCALSERFM